MELRLGSTLFCTLLFCAFKVLLQLSEWFEPRTQRDTNLHLLQFFLSIITLYRHLDPLIQVEIDYLTTQSLTRARSHRIIRCGVPEGEFFREKNRESEFARFTPYGLTSWPFQALRKIKRRKVSFPAALRD